MDILHTLKLSSPTIVEEALASDKDMLRIEVELPVIPDAAILTGTIRHVADLQKIVNKPIRLYSRNAPIQIEKIFLSLLGMYDRIVYTNIDEEELLN